MILVLAALLLVALLSFVALAVDIGIIATARAQLKTVTDSAALAGARQLASERRLNTTITNLNPEISLATSEAIATGNTNSVLGQLMQLTSANIIVGYKNVTSVNPDPPDNVVSTAVASTQFNSVQVTASVTIPALFSAVFRSTGSTVTVTSTATVKLVSVTSYASNNNLNAWILPIVLAKASYDDMMNGTTGDSYSFNPDTYRPPGSNGVTNGPDGVKESVVYPVTSGNSGNWGTINFGVSNNSTSTLGAQIRYGMTPAQIVQEYPAGTVVVPHQFNGDPGISAGIKDDLTSMIGKAMTVPIYDSSGGNGNNAWFHVSSFASIRIVAVDLTGNPKYVVLQPAINTDPTAIPNTGGEPLPWTSGGMIILHLSR